MKKTTIIIGIGLFVIGILTFLMSMIADIIGLVEIANFNSSYGYNEYMAYLTISAISELITDFIVICICIAGIYFCYKEEEPKKGFHSAVAILLIMNIVSQIVLYIGLGWFGGDSLSRPTAIISLVFVILSFLLLLGALGCNIETNLLAKKVCAIFAVLLLFANAIISLIENTPSGFGIAIQVFLLIFYVVYAVYIASFNDVFVSNSGPSYVFVSKEVIKEDAPKKPIEGKDPVSELQKLKLLYDEGILSQEEYEEKRKKYIDKL